LPPLRWLPQPPPRPAFAANTTQEKAVASGTSHNGRAYVEFWASEKSGTWSVVTVMPNGMSCLTSAGQDFQPLPGKIAKDRTPVT